MDNQEFYVVDPEHLRFPFLSRPMQWRRDQLRVRVRSAGALWATLRMRSGDLIAILGQLGTAVGKGGELSDYVFENSPFGTLPLDSTGEYDPFFGYFRPEDVNEYNRLLKDLPESFVQWLSQRGDDGMAERVLYALTSSFGEAALRGQAVAIDHC